MVSGCIALHLWPVVDGEMKYIGIWNIVAAATTSTWVAQIPGFQLCSHNSSKVWTFDVGIKYGLKILFGSATPFCIPHFKQLGGLHLQFQTIEMTMQSKSSCHLALFWSLFCFVLLNNIDDRWKLFIKAPLPWKCRRKSIHQV